MNDDERALEHAWKYFELHAGQRVSIFNFFVVFSGLLVTGLGASFQDLPRYAVVGVTLGLLLAILSYLFFRLDQRVSFLLKHSEDYIRTLEPPSASLFGDEVGRTVAAKQQGYWTYGQVFRTMFFVMGIIGAAGAVYSGVNWAWADKCSSLAISEVN